MTNGYLDADPAFVEAERSDDHPLPVTGVVPPDLDGRLLRNGAGPVVPPHGVAHGGADGGYQGHWSTGDGMVHAISLSGERATGYRNRWVRTRRLAARLGTPPPSGPGEPLASPANHHVLRHGGATLALSDSGFPHALSDDLERATIHDFDGDLASPMAAHPVADPETGELHFFGCDPFGPPFLRYHVADRDGHLVRTEEVELPQASLMHAIGVSAARVLLFDLPVVLDPDLARAGRTLPYRWRPDAPARVGVMPRSTGVADLRWIAVAPCFVSHVLNAFDQGDRVVVDLVRYGSAFDDAPAGATGVGSGQLVRWSVDPFGGHIEERQIDDAPLELPRVDDRVAGRPHRHGYLVLTGTPPDPPVGRALVQVDLERDRTVRYEPGPGRSPSEPVFVRAADGRADDEGWVLTLVDDTARQASDLVILDGTAFAGPPVATVHLPARVPAGMHGSWVPAGS